MKWEIEASSKEYVPAKVKAPHDPTGLTVMFAFTPDDTSVGATWYSGVWDGAAVLQNDGSYIAIAQCLVGPSGGEVELDEGTYIMHVRVTDNPEAPVKRVGVLKVF
jgi:hypothetical protein